MPSFGQRILWRRMQDYLAAHQPLIIGVVGDKDNHLVAEALSLVLKTNYKVRSLANKPSTPTEVALSVLGLNIPSSFFWSSLLSRSLVHEVAETEPEVIIVELPLCRPGDIAWMAKRLPLKVVVMTGVDSVDLDYFHNKADIVHEQQAALVNMSSECFAILNVDDSYVLGAVAHTKAKVITYGHNDSAHVRLKRMQRLSHGIACAVSGGESFLDLHLPNIIVRQQLSAVLAALAVSRALGIKPHEAAQALQLLAPPAGCMGLVVGRRGAKLIDGSADATPESMMSGLETLRSMPGRRKIAILGDLFGLSQEANMWYKKIGKFAGETAHVVIGVGEGMRTANVEAVLVGADTHHFGQSDEVGKWFADFIQDGDVVLITGSHQMKMSEVVERLKEGSD